MHRRGTFAPLSIILLGNFVTNTVASNWSINWSSVKNWVSLSCPLKCPTDDSYSPECLKSALPPWPICLFHDVPTFVNHAIDSGTRCCKDDGDMSECKCPHKDEEKFKKYIGGWCDGVAACTTSSIKEEDVQLEESYY
uniref:Extracellular membrane protein CFEM domain-containing protein n=1 Tax=Helicotheca tamesis TaxID=374047 RepID=A0A7S2H0G9_9STRA|mmetsp:Transcript_14030/g.19182  ORF Transcript_14030/g.19182 Transcript_14030/m.19182 type:complete len:138 (+) Transcript_14030:69-482(+)